MGLLFDETTRFLKEYGYLSKSENPEGYDDIAVTSAIAKYQQFDQNVAIKKAELSEEPLLDDGIIGPATLFAMSLPRCACPDFGEANEEPALGSGGWKNCHGMDDGHKMIVRVNHANMPGFLKPHWKEITRLKQLAWADIGLLVIYTDEDSKDILTGERVTGTVNSNHSFVKGNGWIGLAIVGNGSNQKCRDTIWAKFHYGYQPRDVLNEWTTLGLHEEGHNAGLRHSRNIMNPSIVPGLEPTWRGTSSESDLVKWFGGDPVSIPGGQPEPPVPPLPPTDGDYPNVGDAWGESFKMWNGMTAQLYRVMGG